MNYQNYEMLDQSFRTHWFSEVLKRKSSLESIQVDLGRVSSNTIVNEKVITSNPDFPWEDSSLIFNNVLGWKFFKERFTQALKEGELPFNSVDILRWRNNKAWTRNDFCWQYISEHPNLDLETVVEMPDKPWDQANILANENVHWADIDKHFIKGTLVNDNLRHLILYPVSYNKNVSIDFMLSNSTWNWNWIALLERSDMTQEQFHRVFATCEQLDSDADLYNALSICKWVDLDFIKSHPEGDWNWELLSQHSNITIETILKNPQYKWNWRYYLSRK